MLDRDLRAAGPYSGRFFSDNGAFTYLEERFLGALNNEAAVLYFLYLSDDTAVRNDLVIDL